MFYRILKYGAFLQESTVFQSDNWAAVAYEFANLIKYLSKEDYLGMGEYQDFVDKGFLWNGDKYYVDTFETPDEAHYVEGFVNKQSHGTMSWGTWYCLAYFNRDKIVEAFIGNVSVTPREHDTHTSGIPIPSPTGESYGE